MRKLMLMFLLLAVSLCLAPAEEIPDFLLDFRYGTVNYLYPENDYHKNPGVLVDIRERYIMPSVNWDSSSTRDVWTRQDDSIGAKGGTRTSKTSSSDIDFRLNSIIPLADATAGAYLYFGKYSDASKDVYEDYNSADQDSTSEDGSLRWSFNLGGRYAKRIGAFDTGARAGYSHYSDSAKARFTKVTDPSVSDDPFYMDGDGGINTGQSLHSLNTTLGFRSQQNDMTMGLGVFMGVSGSSSPRYVAVDKDGDLRAEELVPYQQYATSTETWGLGLDYYDSEDSYRTFALTLYPSIIKPLENGMTGIVSGRWNLFNSQTETAYVHNTKDDKSRSERSTGAGFDNFILAGGVAFSPFDDAELRVGAGLERSHERIRNEVLDANGDSIYNAKNSKHYKEVNWAAAPQNEDVVSWDSQTDKIENTLTGLAGFQYSLSEKVLFYSQGSAGFSFGSDVYKVFNVADEKVWEEKVPNTELFWTVDLLAGCAVRVHEKAVISFSISNNPEYLRGSLSSSSDKLPVSGGDSTTDLTGDLHDSSNSSFNLKLECALTL